MGNIEIAYADQRPQRADGSAVPRTSDGLIVDSGPAGASAVGVERRGTTTRGDRRALITRPAIVLADEPTGNLDTKNSDAVLKMLLRSNRELGQTTLMITHNPEAAAIAGRILHMRDGEIVQVESGAGHPGASVAYTPDSVTAVLRWRFDRCSAPGILNLQ